LRQGEFPLTQERDEFGIPVEKIKGAQPGGWFPAHFLKGPIAERPLEGLDVIENQLDSVHTSIVVAGTVDFSSDLYLNLQLFTQLAL
jgi:hypothetical protein